MLSLLIRTSFSALHQYPSAPDTVHFLQHLHAHTFNVTVKIEVRHANREQEFFIVRRELDRLIEVRFLLRNQEDTLPVISHSPSSCESIAEKIAELMSELGHPVVSVEVQEDDGCSGLWEIDG